MAEWIQLAFVSVLTVAVWLRPLPRPRQLTVTAVALLTVGGVFLARHFSHRLSPFAASVLWDWLPLPLFLLPYWQIGQFITAPDSEMEKRLAEFDRHFFRRLGIEPSKISIGAFAGGYLELAYLMVYPVVPLGLGALYLAGLRQAANYYWIVVLIATYICFGITPFVRAMPPRALRDYNKFRIPESRIGMMNHFILRRASIKAISFPSGHVASAMSSALVLLRLEPAAGLIFLFVALSIAVATVAGGYHYAADVLLASLVAILVFAATFWIL